jgi:hypothetical protein
MSERAEGFWWVHVAFESPSTEERSTSWYVAYVEGGTDERPALHLPGHDDEFGGEDDPENEYWFIEWGPYLGKQPAEAGIPKVGAPPWGDSKESSFEEWAFARDKAATEQAAEIRRLRARLEELEGNSLDAAFERDLEEP